MTVLDPVLAREPLTLPAVEQPSRLRVVVVAAFVVVAVGAVTGFATRSRSAAPSRATPTLAPLVRRLDREHLRDRRRLADARTPRAQAAAAQALAVELRRLGPRVPAARAAARAYAGLAAAARAGDHRRWLLARQAVDRAEARLAAALRTPRR